MKVCDMKRLSIVIVTYNSERDIFDCISSVFRHNDIGEDNLEVIVVDNDSRDGEGMFRELRRRFGECLVLVSNGRNGGYGQGNNVGIRRASAPVVMIMNPDVRLTEPVFGTALQAFDSDSRLSLYGMKMMLTETRPSRSSFVCTYMMNGYLSTLLSAFCTRFDLYIPRCMYIAGACFFLRKSMFDDIGMFDESVFLYGEEDDIRYRLTKRFGAHFKYNKRLHYLHLAMGREPSIKYEKTKIDVAVEHAVRKGYPRERMLRNRLQNTRLLLWREKLRNKTSPQYAMLRELTEYIKSQIK